MHHQSIKLSGRQEFELSELVSLCGTITAFLDDYSPQAFEDIYPAFLAGARLSVVFQEMQNAYVNTGFEIHDDMSYVNGNAAADEIRKYKGEELVEYIQGLLMSAALKFAFEYRDQIKALEKAAMRDLKERVQLTGDIHHDWKNSAVKVKKLKSGHAHAADHSHDLHQAHQSHRLFSHRHRLNSVEKEQLYGSANGSNTFPRHGLSV